ncbi:MAG TPA: XrtA system polysaccharide chain length determinant [Vicinamibacterales bacterium]|nr:XrtA system polysaccharide chain length determinant [Vicinamibacterales bacterium]
MQELLQQTLSEMRSAWRFRWFAVAGAWGVGILGLGTVMSLPDIYEASARLYVDGSSVLRPLLNDRIVAPDVATHLLYARQALLGREYLERVATDNRLDVEATTPAAREKVFERLREGVVIDAVPADANNRGNGSTIFTIRYRNERPDVAMGVVSSLMTLLIEDTRGANRQGTDLATRFLDERIAEHETRLEQAEHALAEFQRANSETLPGTEGNYFERMQRERDTLEQTRRDLRLAESRAERLQQQLTSETPLTVEDANTNVREPPANSIDARIRDQRLELDRLMLQYTERHPEVIARRESLQRHEAQRTEQLRALGIADTDQQISALGANPVYQAVQIKLNEAEVEIATLQADVRDRERRLKELQALIDEVPRVEAELAQLNRDYTVINSQYQALIQSRETQQLSEQASSTDQVAFRILNPPRTETDPVAPRRLLLLAGVLVAALGAGGGLSYVLSQLRPVFSTVRELREVSGLPVIGSISRALVDPLLAQKRRFEVATFSAAIGGLVLVIGGVALFELVGSGVHSLVGGAS